MSTIHKASHQTEAARQMRFDKVSPPRHADGLLMRTAQRPDAVMMSGAGSWMTDHSGTRYLDFVQGRGTNALGHCPDCVVEALTRQARMLINPGSLFLSQPALALAGMLVENSCFSQIFFANSGTEANECAIKLARKWGKLRKNGAHQIITFQGAFHGRTYGAMSATDKPGWAEYFSPLLPGFPKAQLNDISSIQALIGQEVCAVMLEVAQGEAGVIQATPAFLAQVRQLCDHHGLLLVLDEVQTGMGRLGRLFGHQHFGVEPDVITLGKGLGGGVPIAAVLAKAHACLFEHGDHGGTFNGSPMVVAAALALTSKVLETGFLEEVRALGDYLAECLSRLSLELGLGEESGVGLLRRLDLGAAAGPEIVAFARDRLKDHEGWQKTGVLLNSPRPNVLRFMPPLNVTRAEIDMMIRGLDLSIRHVMKRGRAARLPERLSTGPRFKSGIAFRLQLPAMALLPLEGRCRCPLVVGTRRPL